MAWANALLVIPPGQGRMHPGESVTALALEPEWLLDPEFGYDKATWQTALGQ
jgi:hypothetical protein